MHMQTGKIMKTAKIVMLLIIVVFMLGCHYGGTNEVPPELMGSWKSSNPRYADRLLRFTAGEIHFGIGKGLVDKYVITKVKTSEMGHQTTKYVIHYQNQDEDDSVFSFTYNSAHSGSIMIAHQEGIWRKAGTSTAK